MRFEDLEVWKRSARLSADIYKELSDLKDYVFRDQITRSGLSIPSNIAEGIERESAKECVNFTGDEIFTDIRKCSTRIFHKVDYPFMAFKNRVRLSVQGLKNKLRDKTSVWVVLFMRAIAVYRSNANRFGSKHFR